jgi:hypothetical protein
MISRSNAPHFQTGTRMFEYNAVCCGVSELLRLFFISFSQKAAVLEK